MYKNICLLNVFLSVAGCISQIVGMSSLGNDTISDVNWEDKSDRIVQELIYLRLLLGGSLIIYPLYHIYFTLLLFPYIYQNQFLRLSIACTLLILHCFFYVPYFVDDCGDYVDSLNESDEYSSTRNYDDLYRNLASAFGATAGGLIMIIIVCVVIIGCNIHNYRKYNNNEEIIITIRTISQLNMKSKQSYMICIMILVIGLVVYLFALGTANFTMTLYLYGYSSWNVLHLVTPCILFGVIVVAVDVCFCYYVR